MEIKKLAKMLGIVGIGSVVIITDVLIGISIDKDFDKLDDQKKISEKMFNYLKIYLKSALGLKIILLLDELFRKPFIFNFLLFEPVLILLIFTFSSVFSLTSFLIAFFEFIINIINKGSLPLYRFTIISLSSVLDFF